ncbi:MAG: P1 family peptidase [Alphaproteobacteria bacterium]|nr:P1 family peptidase [Alphaproteobacteria bacterium]
MKTGSDNAITDVPGLAVGTAEAPDVRTGVTVVLPDIRAVAAVDVRGGGTGTRELELLGPDGTVDAVDAIVLSGGSAFGLAAADGVAGWLAEAGRGFPVGDMRVPLVPAAILFDLLNGGDKSSFTRDTDTLPYRELGRRAAESAGETVAEGSVGAGCGATTTGHDGRKLKGGQGTASVVLDSGTAVGALVAVNALGSVVANARGQFLAGSLEQDGEFGGRGGPDRIEPLDHPLKKYGPEDAGTNTTLAVVATDAPLDARQARRVAMMAQAGLARAIRPVFTPMDGDVVFALSTAQTGVSDHGDVARIGMAAADCVARAAARGVYAATALDAVWPDYSAAYSE